MGSRVASSRPMTCSTTVSTSFTRLRDLAPGAAETVLDLGPGLGQPLDQLLAADLGTLDAEHTESDDDVGGVSNGFGDLLRDVLEFGHRMSFLSGGWSGGLGRGPPALAVC